MKLIPYVIIDGVNHPATGILPPYVAVVAGEHGYTVYEAGDELPVPVNEGE